MPASTSIGVVPIADIVGSGYVTSTDSLHNNSVALTSANSALSNISSSVNSSLSLLNSSINSMVPDNGLSANAGMYNNRIIAMNPPAAYTEVCFKSGSTYYDARSAGAATGGGNCSVGDIGFVMEANERGAQLWNLAKIACTQINMRLPEPLEWQYACNNAGTWSLSTMTTNWEWASNTTLSSYNGGYSYGGLFVTVLGSGGCNYSIGGWVGRYDATALSTNFRCAR